MAIDIPPTILNVDTPVIPQANPSVSFPPAPIPFGMRFREPVEILVAGSTTTTKTVSVTSGPDTDTDPEDSDFN